jgi:carbonic anhydrase
VFHEGPNDLFVVRVAGNVLGPDILGSLCYAIDNLGGSLRLIVVLGHSSSATEARAGGCGDP